MGREQCSRTEDKTTLYEDDGEGGDGDGDGHEDDDEEEEENGREMWSEVSGVSNRGRRRCGTWLSSSPASRF